MGQMHMSAIGVLPYHGPTPYQVSNHLQTQLMALLHPQHAILVTEEGLQLGLELKCFPNSLVL